MKLILTEYPDGHCEVSLQDASGGNRVTYAYDTKKEAVAFCSGFQVAKMAANRAVQSLPMGYETVKA